jgi:hypothetical protein
MIDDCGWTEDDLRRLELLKESNNSTIPVPPSKAAFVFEREVRDARPSYSPFLQGLSGVL